MKKFDTFSYFNTIHECDRQTGFVDKDSDYLQLTKFWPSHAPGNGVCGGAQIFGSALLQPARSVCVASGHFFIHSFSSTAIAETRHRLVLCYT